MINTEFVPGSAAHRDEGPGCFVLDFSRVKSPLRVRTRRSGDRMIPKGMAGSQKIKDIFLLMRRLIVKRDPYGRSLSTMMTLFYGYRCFDTARYLARRVQTAQIILS
ncbi:tRNA lysidine(34) synthetase TilS [Terrilactibacillus sp. S3-3]|nr:tRNA lysidine(34) synthetase TilS [Terrilactibacillus sp. S3-3]